MKGLTVVIVLAVLFLIAFAVQKSFKWLGTDIEPYYEFDLNLKRAGMWSILFYIALVSLLALVVFASFKFNFGLQPA